MTLRLRMAVILACVALGVGAFATVASYLTTASQLRSAIDDTLRSRAVAVSASIADPRTGHGHAAGHGPDGGGESACPVPGEFAPATAAQLVSTVGTVTPCISGAPALPVDDRDRNVPDGGLSLRTVGIDGHPYRLLTTAWHPSGSLQIARSLTDTNGLLASLRIRLALVVALATVLAAALGWTVATWLARPIMRLRDAAHHIATTLDLSTPIDVAASGEVGSLASSFATMVAAVGRSQEQQRRLVSDASHEIRTPLTSLRSNLELIGQIEQLPPAERSEVVADVLQDVDELSSLMGELVDLASDLAAAEPAEAVRLGDLSRAVAARMHRRADRLVTVDDGGASDVIGRPRQLERAISNLVDNAVKYSEPATPIGITIEDATVTVRDRGRGIPAADLAHIFDRFYRAVDVRTQPGSGLGLSIVDEIVRSHGGSVFARNRAGGGVEAGFTLGTPVAAADPA
jgi:two-component system sensor histidine kinase MprB